MIDTRQVRTALRQLRTDRGLSTDVLADKSGVDRATIYRIENLNQEYAPRIETVSALVDAFGLTTATFFWNIESSDQSRHSGDQRSDPSGGSSDVPASVAARIQQLELENESYKSVIADLQRALGHLGGIARTAVESGVAIGKRRPARKRSAR
jgi:DNA-binding XRE family transcriptional regulator